MPITVENREDGRVRYFVITDPWVTNDLVSLYPADRAYRDNAHFTVHTMMNISKMKQIPPGLLAVRVDAPAFFHPHSGYLLMIGAGMFPRVMAETIFKLAHYDRARFFETEEEGWAFIQKVLANEPVASQAQTAPLIRIPSN